MRALFVSPYLPTPGSGGRTRLINLMERLAARHTLSLVAFAAPDQDPGAVPYPSVVFPHPALVRRGGIGGTIDFYRDRLAGRLPVFVACARDPRLASAVAAEVERVRPDVVQVEHPEMGQYLTAIPGGPVRVLDFHDVASRWIGRVAASRPGLRAKALLALELTKTRRYEARIARIPDLIFVCSPFERQALRRLAGVESLVIPNGVDAKAFTPLPHLAEAVNRILFVGPLTFDANLDGLRWFSREILPLVRREVPDASVDVVGLPLPDSFPDGVRLLGKVDDVRPHLARAPLSVVPIRVASGTRYKILEALSMERAVVSTSLGAEGLGVAHGEHLLIADTPGAFASAVVELLRSPELRARLGAAGRRFIAERYDWGPLVEMVEASWDAAIASRRRADTR